MLANKIIPERTKAFETLERFFIIRGVFVGRIFGNMHIAALYFRAHGSHE